MHFRLQIRVVVICLVAPATLLFSAEPAEQRDWKQRLAEIEWVQPGTRIRKSLRLHADGSYQLTSIRRKAVGMKKPPMNDRLPAGQAGEIVDLEPPPEPDDSIDPARLFFRDTKSVNKGKWQVVSSHYGIVLLDSESTEAVRLFQRADGIAKGRYEFESVWLAPIAKMSLQGDWIPVSNQWRAHYSDVLPFCNEVPPKDLLGPNTGAGRPKPLVPEDELRRIRQAIPKGWHVSTMTDIVIVWRTQTTEFDAAIPSAPGFEGRFDHWNELTEERYRITLRFEPRMSREARQQFIDRTNERIALLQRNMAHFKDPPNVKPSSLGYRPKTPADKELLEQYRQQRQSLREVANFFGETDSLRIVDNLWSDEWIVDRGTARECKVVLRKVQSLFKPYDLMK